MMKKTIQDRRQDERMISVQVVYPAISIFPGSSSNDNSAAKRFLDAIGLDQRDQCKSVCQFC